MFCINCFHTKTRVTNSRANKKTPQIWRRRTCDYCGKVFTTIESAAIKVSVSDAQGNKSVFSKPRLAMNIAGYLTNENHDQLAESAFWLAETVEQSLITKNFQNVTLSELNAIVHTVLTHYDPTAGVLYGTNYGIINPTAKPRRGRPSYL